MDKQQFLKNMQFLVNNHQSISIHMDHFISFDPQVKPIATAVQQTIGKVAEELKQRGLVEELRMPFSTLGDKEATLRWLASFASYSTAVTNVPYAQANDAALVPALQAYEEARKSLRAYCKDRVEFPA